MFVSNAGQYQPFMTLHGWW